MKIFVKNLKGSCFNIEVKAEDRVFYLKKKIETIKGIDVYPATQQMLISQGKILHDDNMTLEENKITENSLVVIMVKKSNYKKPSGPTVSAPGEGSTGPENKLEGMIQKILDVGRGFWKRDTVVLALRATSNNPERAIKYLYSSMPKVRRSVANASTSATHLPHPPHQQTQPPASVPSNGPNTSPLDLFPRRLPGSSGGAAGISSLDILRNIPQFQVMRAMVQAHPELLQPILQEMTQHNPLLSRLIQEHPADFHRLINESTEGQGEEENNLVDHRQRRRSMPQTPIPSLVQETTVPITREEREAIDRLEALGFDRAMVLQAFLACNKNEQQAANYLLDHINHLDH